MRYEPRQRQHKWIWRIVILAAALLFLISFLLYHFVIEPQEVRGHFQACGWGPDEIREQLEDQQEEIIELQDYLFYGESLALYMEPYDGEGDPIVGKTLELVNICSGTQYSFTVGDAADRQIYLPDLEEGTYEIYIMDSFTLKRAVFQTPVSSDSFDTIRRNGKVKRVQLIADSTILDDYGGSLDQNYAFLNVTSATPDARTADVLIDPFGIYTTIWGGVDQGLQGNGITESEEAYDVAVQMQQLLEKYGLNVILARGEDELVEYYGENSRVAKGYEANAKYVISIGFTYGEGRSGLESYHGIQSSNHLTNSVMYYLREQYGIEGSSSYTSETSVPGVFSSFSSEGDDGRMIYDSNFLFREAGGKATFAGQMDSRSEQNAQYSDANGMQGMEFDLACLSDADDVANYKENKAVMIQGIVEGLADALDLTRQ